MNSKKSNADSTIVDNRLDLYLMRGYAGPENIRSLRQRVIEGWEDDPVLRELAPSQVADLPGLSIEEERAAVRNLADFFFEPYVVSSMRVAQVDAYFADIAARIPLICDEGITLRPNAPLILETLHHSCVFSICYLAITRLLVPEFGYDRVILLHQREEIDPRLIACQVSGNFVTQGTFLLHNVRKDGILSLRKEITERSIVLYFGDMPGALFEGRYDPDTDLRQLRLVSASAGERSLQGVSIADKLARLFKADHLLLDAPADDHFWLRPRAGEGTLCCPLSNWVFWPALDTLFAVGPETAGGVPVDV